MRIIKNEKGEALILVLFFSLIASLMILAVLYVIMRGTTISGMQKRYQTSLDAANAGVSVYKRFLTDGSYSVTDPMIGGTGTWTANPTPTTCLYKKLYFSYSTPWTPECNAAQMSMDAETSPDMTLHIKGEGPNTYEVYQKIVDSRRGLTPQRPPGVEVANGVAYGGETGITLEPQAYFFYAVEIKAVEHRANAPEREVSRISFDYAW